MLRLLAPYLTLMRGRPKFWIATVALALLQAALLAPVVLLVRRAFETALPQRDTSELLLLSAGLLALYAASTAVGFAGRYLVLRAVHSVVADLRSRLWTHLYALPLDYFDHHPEATSHTILVQDSERITVVSGQTLAAMLPNAVVAVALAAVAVVIDPVLSGAVAVIVPLMAGLAVLFRRGLHGRVQAWQTAFDRFSAEGAESLRIMVMVRLLGTRRVALTRRLETVESLRSASLGVAWQSGLWAMAQQGIAAAAGVVVLIVGGQEVIDRNLSIGQLLSFYALVALLLRSVGSVVGALPQLAVVGPCLARIQNVLSEEAAPIYSGTLRHDLTGDLELRNVWFAYSGAPLLRDICLRVRSGERLAIIGPNGAGKSTLASILLAIHRPDRGEVLADGIPFDELDIESLRPQLGVMLQDALLGSGSLREQVLAGRVATDDDVHAALVSAGLGPFVEQLPDGLDSQLGDAARLVSGGQQRRLGLARALLTRPAVLVLDEPTSHLDDEGVADLMAVLDALPHCPTVVMVTHDPLLMRSVDRVIHLRNGQVMAEPFPAEQGAG